MIKHIVMWNVCGQSAAEKRQAAELVKAEFEALEGQIPGLLEIEVGFDRSGVDYACDVVLYTVFDTAEALEAYAVHPRHLAVKQRLEGKRIARHQVDYPVQSVTARGTAPLRRSGS